MTALAGTLASARAAALRPAHEPLAEPALRTLRGTLDGDVLVAGNRGYDEYRGIQNLHYESRPAVIVRPASAIDVARTVRVARELDLELTVRSGGHSMAGHTAAKGGLLLDMRSLNQVAIDPIRWTGSAGGGTLAGEYTLAAAEHGFATPFGDAATVGLGGLTTGGGIGWLSRKHGLTIDNLLEADVVTADGEVRTVSAVREPELFWAIRGGGGNFGIVTRFQYRLHPVSMVTGGALFLPLTKPVLRGLVDASLEAPDALTAITMVMPLPPAPFVPQELVGTPAVMMLPVFAGPLDQGEAAMAPFRALATPLIDMVGPMPYHAMYELTAGASEPGSEVIRSSFLPDLDEAALDAIVERHHQPAANVLQLTQIRVLGGAVSRIPAGATAFAHRESPVLVAALSQVMGDWDAAVAETEAYHAQLAGGATGVYANFLGDEGEARARQAYPGPTYERLVRAKRRYDPDNVFHANQNIKPS
ncbi:MAG TPA: FAD-binding oxidoreductase [Candidatus Limnocylindrales bacterium]|nr:FAD-binding oxidoreductase [Candidatus Limnocylindrales bacterium]